MSTTIEYYEDYAGEWRWRMKARNGLVIASSGEGYHDRAGVRRAVRRIVKRVWGVVRVYELSQDALKGKYDAGLSKVQP